MSPAVQACSRSCSSRPTRGCRSNIPSLKQVTGVDLVQSQIRLAQGATLKELGLDKPIPPRGYAIQCRVNMETIKPDGSVRPGGGTLTVYEAPNGPGVRTDGFGYAGYKTSDAFDSLLAKVIAHSPSPDFAVAVGRETRALSEFRLDGVSTNIAFLRNVLAHPDFVAGKVHTRWLDEHVKDLAAETEQRQRFVEAAKAAAANDTGFAGARVNSRDPLALFAHDAAVKAENTSASATHQAAPDMTGPDGSVGIASPIQGTIVAIDVAEGDEVRTGQQVAVVEAMKMEHVIAAPHSGIVRAVTMAAGDVVREGFPIVFVREAEVKGGAIAAAVEVDLDHIRDDLRENIERHALTLDENRPEAVARRRKTGGNDAARKHRTTGRSRLVQRILAADRGAPAPALHDGGAAEEYPGRRRRRRHVLDQRRPVRRNAVACGAGAL